MEPLTQPVDAVVAVPGSKSETNRALVAAALATGTSSLQGALFADDTEAMLGVVDALGAQLDIDRIDRRIDVVGTGAALRPGPLDLDVRLSGTTSRFATPLAARGPGPYRLDGAAPMRARPMGATVDALRSLGVTVEGDQLPLVVGGGLAGGAIEVPADASSQFVSGLLLAAPGLAKGLDLRVVGDVVSQPYLDLTVAIMRSFGAEIEATPERYIVPAGGPSYAGTTFRIEPDASAASYFFAAAAVTGGRVRIDGLGADSKQGDVEFVRVLERMGATVDISESSITVTGPDQLAGVDVDMADISDTAQTLAAIAPFASGRTRITGIGFIRAKETDRIAAVVTELCRLGIDATEESDGILIEPGLPTPGVVQTYDDHRMAMSFALIGLRSSGIEIADPGCVDKTFPDFWDVLEKLRTGMAPTAG